MASQPSPPTEPGALPARVGRYRIESRLGRGGMGDVFLGVHETDGQRAAVKVLPAELARETGFLARFEREVETLEKLDHPNIVKLIEHGTDDGVPFLAMEFAEGKTILQRIREERRLPWRESVEIAVEVCEALRHAHAFGVVHRDLKPSNLMHTPTGVKLLDFGVAQVFNSGERLTVTGGVVGTAEFMSPEQAEGRRVTAKSDIYSLGSVLYAMLTGRPPFSGSSMLDVIHKHRFARCDSTRHYDPGIPSWLDRLVGEMLEKEPSKRPPDARVLANRLREIPKKVDLSEADPDAEKDLTFLDGATVPIAAGAGVEMFGELDGLTDEDDSGRYVDVETRTAEAIAVDDPEAIGHRGPGEASIMRNLLVAELSGDGPHPLFKPFESLLVLVLLLIAVFAGGVAWFNWQHVSPEERFATALEILEEDPSPRWLLAVREHLEPLVADDPDRWAARVEPLITRVEAWNRTRPRGLSRLTEAVGFGPGEDAYVETSWTPNGLTPPAVPDAAVANTPAVGVDEADAVLTDAEALLGRLERNPRLTRDDVDAAEVLLASFDDSIGDNRGSRVAALRTRLAGLRDALTRPSGTGPLLRAAVTEIRRLAEAGDRDAARRLYEAAGRLYEGPDAAAVLRDVAVALDFETLAEPVDTP
ncbi:MAG: serine/threonine-protein kinase [Planctomycetota bacterium]